MDKLRKNYEVISIKKGVISYTLNELTHIVFTCDFLKDKLGGLCYFCMLGIQCFGTADVALKWISHLFSYLKFNSDFPAVFLNKSCFHVSLINFKRVTDLTLV